MTVPQSAKPVQPAAQQPGTSTGTAIFKP
jgi:hypothetical protein